MRKRRSRIWSTRKKTQQDKLIRGLFLGWSTKALARAIHASPETVRDHLATVEFQTAYAEYQREQMKRIDRWMPRLLLAAIKALAQQLKNADWRARDAAVTKILNLHGPALERIILRFHEDGRSLTPADASTSLPPMDDLTDEQRGLYRQLLQSYRASAPRRELPPALSGTIVDD